MSTDQAIRLEESKEEKVEEKVEEKPKEEPKEELPKKLSQEEEQFVKRFGSLKRRESLLRNSKKKRFDSADYFLSSKEISKK